MGAQSCRSWGCGKVCGQHSKCSEAMSGFRKGGGLQSNSVLRSLWPLHGDDVKG